MASKSRRISNNAGSAKSFLNAVKKPDTGSSKIDNAIQAAGKNEKLVKSILLAVKQCIDDADDYQKELDSKSIDVTLGRIATLLDEFKDGFVKEELEDIKKEILDEISGFTTSGVLKSFLLSQVSSLFDDSVKKDDIDELKIWISENISQSSSSDSSSSSSKTSSDNKDDEISSMPNEKIFNKISSQIAKINEIIKDNSTKVLSKINNMFMKLNSIKFGGMSSTDKKKQKLKDRLFGTMSNVIGKIWKTVQPFIDKAVAFVKNVITKFIIVPIALIVVKVLLIAAAITALAVGLVLAYIWIKNKIVEFWDYVTSGRLWEDIKEKLVQAWGWMQDFGKWIGDAVLDALEYVFVDMWVDLGKWVWEKLCEFGNWLYDNYIKKYIVDPFNKYIWEPVKKLWNETIWPKIEPFIQSLTDLKNKIVKAFSTWDVNKSIWENLKNIGGILKDAMVEWWNKSPFKTFYEQNIKPFVESAKDLFNRLENLGGFIKDAIVSWWNGDSSLGDTLKNIGSKVWDTIVEWWNKSIFKKYWEKLKVYLDDLLKPLRDWWKESWFGKTFQKGWESLKEKWDEFKKVWDDFSFKKALTSWWEQSTLKSQIDTIKGWVNDVVNAVSNFGTTIKDSIVSWWNESDLKKRIDKFADFGKSVKDAVVTWYNESALKTWINKVADFGKSVKDAIVEWYNNSAIKQWIDTIKKKIELIKERLGLIIIKLPLMGYVRLFGPLIGKTLILSDAEADEEEKRRKEEERRLKEEARLQKQLKEFNKLQKELDDITAGRRDDSGMFTISNAKRKKQIEAEMAKMGMSPRQVASQQIQQAAKPIQSIESMKEKDQAALHKTGEDIGKEIAQKEQKQQQFDAQQADKSDKILARIDSMDNGINKKLKDPYVVPMYIPSGGQDYSAMMYAN